MTDTTLDRIDEAEIDEHVQEYLETGRADTEDAAVQEFASNRFPSLPEDDTEADEHGHEPDSCVMCERDPAIKRPVKTTNRSLDIVGGRVYFEPVCDGHDFETTELVWRLITQGVLMDAIQNNIVTQQEAFTHIAIGPHDDFMFIPSDAEIDTEEERQNLISKLKQHDIKVQEP